MQEQHEPHKRPADAGTTRYRVVTGDAHNVHSHHPTRAGATTARDNYLTGASHELAQIEFTHAPVDDSAPTWLPDFNDDNKLGSDKDKVDRLTRLIAIFENKSLDFSKNRDDGDNILGHRKS